MVKARFINDTHTVNVRSIGSATSHEQLIHRDLPEQHPIDAITGLRETLNSINGDIGDLSNLTTENKVNLVSAINEVDSHADINATNLSNHINDKSNPHEVTKAQVGLGNCDNTADIDKPISTATQTALDNITNGTTSIAYDNTTSGLSATTLQGAIDEIDGDLDNVEALIPSAASTSNQLVDKLYVDSADGGLQSQITANAGDIDTIEGKIPTQASTSNKLADKNFVNSSISTNTANFIGTFNSLADLEAYSGTITNNDYAFVVGTDSAGNTVYNRYKYTTATNPASWQFEYALNNSSFTANQWAAINSGATSTNIAQIATNTSAISGLTTSKQDEITATNKLDSDLVDDSGQTNKFVTASEKAQISTNASNITTLQSGKADKSTTYTKTEVDTIATGKANVSLDNLNADGQMIVDSQNGTISNCILEIPQNIKLTLENSVFTVKADSVVVVANGDTYTTQTVLQDVSRDFSTWGGDGLFYVLYRTNNILTMYKVSETGSGTTLPEDGTTYNRFYLTTDKKIYEYYNGRWNLSPSCYPLCVVEKTGTSLAFAKDSKGRDMIFNGTGFIGHHAFVYPNVKALIPNGFNDDGSLKSIEWTNNALRIMELPTYNSSNRAIFVDTEHSQGMYQQIYGADVENYNDLQQNVWELQYVKSDNKYYQYINGVFNEKKVVKVVSFVTQATAQITDFTIRQPVRLATTEMLDKVQDQVDSKQDTLVSGTNIKTINSTSVLGSGNFTLADQSLSNLDSTGQMVIDSQNGTISNCILEIPQNIKLEISGNTLTLKSGSTVVLANGNTYTTLTTTADVTKTISIANLSLVIILRGSGLDFMLSSRCYSGNTAPETPPQFALWYNTDEKVLYYTNNSGSTWSANSSYPLCMVNTDSNGVPSFAKDSNGNDMIFNGAGFIGHHAFVYPNVKGLIGQGFNDDGSLKSFMVKTNSLFISEMTAIENSFYAKPSNTIERGHLSYVDSLANVPQSPWKKLYVKDINLAGTYYNNTFSVYNVLEVINYTYDGTTVTKFDIRQPYEGARNLLTDDIEEEVATKQADVTTLTGYDSTQTQTLKNINGVLTWVTD